MQDNLWIKAILYRIVRIFIVFLSGIFILDNASIAMEIAGIDMVAATIFYYFYDRWWTTINKYIQRIHMKIKYRRLK